MRKQLVNRIFIAAIALPMAIGMVTPPFCAADGNLLAPKGVIEAKASGSTSAQLSSMQTSKESAMALRNGIEAASDITLQRGPALGNSDTQEIISKSGVGQGGDVETKSAVGIEQIGTVAMVGVAPMLLTKDGASQVLPGIRETVNLEIGISPFRKPATGMDGDPTEATATDSTDAFEAFAQFLRDAGFSARTIEGLLDYIKSADKDPGNGEKGESRSFGGLANSAQNGRETAEEFRRRVIQEMIDRITQDAEDARPFLDDAVRRLLDTNHDNVVDGDDSDYVTLRDTFRRHMDHMRLEYKRKAGENDGSGISDVSGFLDAETLDHVGALFMWALRTFGSQTASMYLGDGLTLSISVDGGGNITVTLSNPDWEIRITHDLPPGVDTGTIRKFENAEQEIKKTRDSLSRKFTWLEDRGALEAVDDKPKPDLQSEAKPPLEEPVEKSQASRPAVNEAARVTEPQERKAFNKEEPGQGAVEPGRAKVVRRSENAERYRPAQKEGVPGERFGQLEGDWMAAKSIFMDMLERIRNEEPGAVYMKKKEAISAIILLVASDNDDGGTDTEGGEEASGSNG